MLKISSEEIRSFFSSLLLSANISHDSCSLELGKGLSWHDFPYIFAQRPLWNAFQLTVILRWDPRRLKKKRRTSCFKARKSKKLLARSFWNSVFVEGAQSSKRESLWVILFSSFSPGEKKARSSERATRSFEALHVYVELPQLAKVRTTNEVASCVEFNQRERRRKTLFISVCRSIRNFQEGLLTTWSKLELQPIRFSFRFETQRQLKKVRMLKLLAHFRSRKRMKRIFFATFDEAKTLCEFQVRRKSLWKLKLFFCSLHLSLVSISYEKRNGKIERKCNWIVTIDSILYSEARFKRLFT